RASLLRFTQLSPRLDLVISVHFPKAVSLVDAPSCEEKVERRKEQASKGQQTAKQDKTSSFTMVTLLSLFYKLRLGKVVSETNHKLLRKRREEETKLVKHQNLDMWWKPFFLTEKHQNLDMWWKPFFLTEKHQHLDVWWKPFFLTEKHQNLDMRWKPFFLTEKHQNLDVWWKPFFLTEKHQNLDVWWKPFFLTEKHQNLDVWWKPFFLTEKHQNLDMWW
ncbi:hypothetical protein STEG23_023686, partial [Scotinomys teguina]